MLRREELLKVAEESTYTTEGSAVNFNQDSKVISNKKESPDTHNNLTKSGINELLTTNVPLKTRNKPERLFTVNVISSGAPSQILTLQNPQFVLFCHV